LQHKEPISCSATGTRHKFSLAFLHLYSSKLNNAFALHRVLLDLFLDNNFQVIWDVMVQNGHLAYRFPFQMQWLPQQPTSSIKNMSWCLALVLASGPA
jgi:hypothetical protein